MENKQLEKSLGVAAALSTVVGMVIGGGVFFKPQAVYTLTGGAPGLGMLVWVLAGIVTIAAGLTAAICIILPCYNSCFSSYVRTTICWIIRKRIFINAYSIRNHIINICIKQY